MKISPLSLTQYFVPQIHITANPNFKLSEPIDLNTEDLSIASNVTIEKFEENEYWAVSLRIEHLANPARNFTYSFFIEVIGKFTLDKEVAEDKRPIIVNVNGPSMLYGIAREVIRGLSAQGPYSAVLLPSVTFYNPPAKPETENIEAPKAQESK